MLRGDLVNDKTLRKLHFCTTPDMASVFQQRWTQLLTLAVLQIAFVYLELGLVFFVAVLLGFLFFYTTAKDSAQDTNNTRQDLVHRSRKKLESQRKKKQPLDPGLRSAYSVFNKDGQRLAGSLTAEHFEASLYGKKTL